MRSSLIRVDEIPQNEAVTVDPFRAGGPGHAARSDARLIMLPARIEDGILTYVYDE